MFRVMSSPANDDAVINPRHLLTGTGPPLGVCIAVPIKVGKGLDATTGQTTAAAGA